MKTPDPDNNSELQCKTCTQPASPAECEKGGLCSKGLCPGTILLVAFAVIYGIVSPIGWIRA